MLEPSEVPLVMARRGDHINWLASAVTLGYSSGDGIWVGHVTGLPSSFMKAHLCSLFCPALRVLFAGQSGDISWPLMRG